MRSKLFLFLIIGVIYYAFLEHNCYAQWYLQAVVSTNDLHAIKVLNSNTVYVVGENEIIARTTNEGGNWIIVHEENSGELFSLDFINENTGFAGGYSDNLNSGIIYKTTNGGNNWAGVLIDSVNIWSLHFIDAYTGIAGGWEVSMAYNFVNSNSGVARQSKSIHSLIYLTTNGGNNWDRIDINTVYEVSDLSFIDASTGWGTGWSLNGEKLVKTTNGGINWNLIWSGEIYDVYSIFFINANTGWITGDRLILKSTNGGSNWFYQIIPYTQGIPELYESYFINESTGWVVGDGSTILKTTNGGENWGGQANPGQSWLWDVYFNNENTGWVVGGNGRILKTTNGGGPIGIQPISTNIPEEYLLYQNYPNPFNPVTTIRFDVPKTSFVKLAVYDILGKENETIIDEQLSSGTYEIQWNASGYTSGVYFYKIRAGDYVSTKKMVLLK